MDRVERQILWLPVVVGAVLGVNGMVGFLISDSQSVLLDGLLSLSYVLVGLVTVWAGHLVTTPSAKYPKGRSGVEPVVNILKSLLLTVVVIYTLVQGVTRIVGGGVAIDYGSAVLFTLISAAITLAATLFSWRRSKKSPTPLVQGDVVSWLIDAASILGVALALGAAYLLDSAGNSAFAGYIDPIIAIVLSLLTIYLPVKLGVTSVLELCGRTVSDDSGDDLLQRARQALESEAIADLDSDTYRVGRETHVDFRVIATQDAEVTDVLRWRQQIEEALDQQDGTVRFTLTLVAWV